MDNINWKVMNRFSLHCLMLFLLYGCIHESPLDRALRLAGDNRRHLEQVLRHYAGNPDDSLKYKAACFLIGNMPGHGWYEGEVLEHYERWIDSAYALQNVIFRAVLRDAFFRQPDAWKDLVWKEDVRHLDSSFLIVHIDSTFERIRQRPWLKSFSFEQLCEHILPYRVRYERPQLFFPLQDSLFDSEVRPALCYDDMKKDAVRIFNLNQPFQVRQQHVEILYRNRRIEYEIVGCMPWALAKEWRGKLLMCPVTSDLNPAFPNRSGRHDWAVMIDNRRPEGYVCLTYEENRKGKIYRRTFCRQDIPKAREEEYVPPFFRTPFHQDVTSLYTKTRDVEVRLQRNAGAGYGYLCVFNDSEWKPVAWARQEKGRCRFRDMGCGVVYLPVVYERGKGMPAGFPFVLEETGHIRILKADTVGLHSLKLTRKYPSEYAVGLLNRGFMHARLEASDRHDFRPFEHAGTFGPVSARQWSSAKVNTLKGFRYWRIRSSSPFTLGECVLTGEKGVRLIPDTVSGAFDDNPLSYEHADARHVFVMDMGEETVLTSAECLLRNDGNNVWPGHWYELNYHDGTEWCSLGVKEAVGYAVEFSGIPGNALLWLRDLTEGREERIFTCQSGEVCFW